MTQTCGVCRTPCPPPFRAPPPELAPDLDSRPGEPTRSTLPNWVRTCRTCTAAAPDLSRLDPSCRATVDGAEYRAIAASEPARAFLRWATLAPDDATRGEALLQAAWAADDAGRLDDATAWRLAAAAAWDSSGEIELSLRRLDVLRRAGALEAAASLAGHLGAEALDESSARIVSFQAARIAEGDRGRHLISSALRPPAHRPHVAHQPRPLRRGFWGLFARR